MLFTVFSHSIRPSIFRFAFDLYHKRLLDVDLGFTNPFRMTTMLGYNYNTKVGTKEIVVFVFPERKRRDMLRFPQNIE